MKKEEKNLYKIARQILRSGNRKKVQGGLRMLRLHTKENPTDAVAWYEYACAEDGFGTESKALLAYERVLKIGANTLPLKEQPGFYLGMGSTLRNLRKFVEANKILRMGIKRHPRFRALYLFIALNDYSRNKTKDAVKILFDVILDEKHDESISEYRRSLAWYSKHL